MISPTVEAWIFGGMVTLFVFVAVYLIASELARRSENNEES